MKKVIESVVIFIFSTSMLYAGNNSGSKAIAKKINVENILKEISRGKQAGMKIDIYQASKKDVVKEWSKLIRQKTKSKVEERDNEVFIIGTNISAISNAPINIYAVINEYLDHVEVNAFFESPNGFITKATSETEYLSCRKFLRDFGVVVYKEAVDGELKDEQDHLQSLQNDLKKIVNSNDKLHKNIGKEERDIVNAKNDIKSNDLNQDRLRKEIHHTKGRIYNIKSEEARKDVEKELNILERDLSKLKRENERFHKEIDKSEAKIRQYVREIEDNTLLVSRKEKEIDAQMNVIYQVEQKLVAIR